MPASEVYKAPRIEGTHAPVQTFTLMIPLFGVLPTNGVQTLSGCIPDSSGLLDKTHCAPLGEPRRESIRRQAAGILLESVPPQLNVGLDKARGLAGLRKAPRKKGAPWLGNARLMASRCLFATVGTR